MDPAEDLKNQVRLVFEKSIYPGDDNLVRRDTDLFYDEYLQVVKALRGRKWQDLTIEVIRPIRWLSLGCITFEAFRYYLPSFMIMAVDHYVEMDMLHDSLLWHLMPDALVDQLYDRPEGMRSMYEDIANMVPESRQMITDDFLDQMDTADEFNRRFRAQPDEFTSRIKGLTAEQRQVILSFLEYINATHRDDLIETVIDSAIDVWKNLIGT